MTMEQKDLFRCLINFFKFFGGIPSRILCDNMSTAADTVYPLKRKVAVDNGNLKITKKDRLKITNYGEKTKSIWLSFHFVYT